MKIIILLVVLCTFFAASLATSDNRMYEPVTLMIALKHYKKGAYPQAEEFCNKVLLTAPGHADALHLLGLVALSVGKYDIALNLAKQAVLKNSKNPIFFNTMGAACYRMGRLQDAVAHFRSALALQERHDPGKAP